MQYRERQISDQHKGLSEDSFLCISRLTPLVNVNLPVKNEQEGITVNVYGMMLALPTL